jgi:RND superfamily putative drug exporter
LYSNVEAALERYPSIGELLVSKDCSTALFRCVTSRHVLLTAAGELSEELEATELEGPLEILVGGLPLYYRGLDQSLVSSAPRAIVFVVLATVLLLFVTLRSVLIPINAVLMNMFSEAAGYGVVVAVFQFGWLGSLIGLEHALNSIA